MELKGWKRRLLVISILAFLLWTSNQHPMITRLVQSTHVKTVENQDNSTRYILYWTSVFGDPTMGFGLGKDPFKDCEFSNCFATNDRDLIPTEQFDAIIFHGKEYKVMRHWYPRKRGFHQKYIFLCLESPNNIVFDQYADRNFYNWTMTYRDDSDIVYPYGRTEEQATKYQIPSQDVIRKKNKTIAWFVSNCYTHGSERRQKYAEELSKYIPVDIYGSCGTYSCPPSEENKCMKMLEDEYFFYLSFENTICKDYVTEKLWKILNYNIVPITLGGSNYKIKAPPNSVIETSEFNNPKELADFLHIVMNNIEYYISYFKWKQNYIINTSNKKTICNLCAALNNPITYSSYESIKEWFYGFNCYL